jgi:5-methyltetrahydropteroyltriglutamate--homocysteine methyltransferase
MRNSSDGILVSHAGSLPRPDELIELNRVRQEGEDPGFDEGAFQTELTAAVRDVVAKQVAAGVTVPGDGEYGKSMGHKVNYGAWWSYSFSRLSGLDPNGPALYDMPPVRSKPGDIHLTSFADRRDRLRFIDAYNDRTSGVAAGRGGITWPRCVGPVSYTGQDAIAHDIANFKAALAAANVSEGFMTSVGPASASRVANEHYKTEEEFIWACADAMREEYQAIIDAGLVLQIDDPFVAEAWDQINPEPSVEDYQRFVMTAIESLNHALRGLPTERIRFHLCWGSWHGPHSTDIEMRDIVDVMLAINAGAYSFEAANARHEHEWVVWQDKKLPEGKVILPGIVSHATNVLEHPELVAQRIVRFADQVGRENVIASTDCGLGGRIHPDIAWAKLETLSAGAALATKQLWP